MKKIILSIFCACCLFCVGKSQTNETRFFIEADGTIGTRTHVKAIGFRTENKLRIFYDSLYKRFPQIEQDDEFLKFITTNKEWAQGSITIRISASIDIGQDDSKTNTVFIFVETSKQKDLLLPGTVSGKRIKAYFLKLYQETILIAPTDKFDM